MLGWNKTRLGAVCRLISGWPYVGRLLKGRSPGPAAVTTLIVRLPQDSVLRGDLTVSVTVAGGRSNSVAFAIC